MHNLLTIRGYPVIYREYHAGHNYPAWRDDIWRGLETLYAPESKQP
jgi:enterochelin esterase-like enzyme